MGRPKLIDLIGNRYNHLTVVSRSEKSRKYVCLCDCGGLFETTKQRLINGRSKSCGCLKSKLLSDSATRHGYSGSPTYQSFISMLHRCYDTNRTNYDLYGGSGIVVEEPSWLEESPNGFLNFLNDVGERPEGCSLDRIDGSKGYSKNNCRWATSREQAANTDRTKQENSTSKYRGVSLRKTTGKYITRIGNGKGAYEWLGDFVTEEEAALRYNERAIELFGKYAKLNNVPNKEQT